ncbi:hypothetical protein AAL_00858 [Moelleriella libera RCEF 2490]|uniref:Uncharacterized protein n=1 Tax=Moelleriella libera RCEF 2490 TaxID=1081109 RepID=A0A166V8R0_9HYPO|nr:hypothetical protein AAL_00858 [Moelleriella libera RCEF 2490]
MAFQQSTRQAVQRVPRAPIAQHDDISVAQRSSSSERRREESQTWVLFSPPTEVTTTSYLTESVQSLETPGRSRLSDLGSLNTVARSEEASDAPRSASALSALDGQAVDEDAELDSLDSHLPGFRSLPVSHRGSQNAAGPVFPVHDGLGSFRLNLPALGTEAQDQIYQFEKFNPRKTRRTLESLENVHLDLDQTQEQAEEKRRRIEAWRLDHSRVLLDEVQRETRRRKKSLASMHRSKRCSETESDALTWHDEDALQPEEDKEGFMARLTRRVVRDLLGIDDVTLSILLGEELPTEFEDMLSSTPRASDVGSQTILTASDEPSWQVRVLERLSRELGLLVNHLSPHPGAFSTYSKVHHMPLPYAGLPVIPESNDAGVSARSRELYRVRRSSVPEFQPTVPRHARPITMTGRREAVHGQGDTDMADGEFTKEEWEKSLDVKLVFRYVVSRFTSRSNNASASTAHHNPPSAQDHAAKAARVRQQHPLIARTRSGDRRSFKGVAPSSPSVLRHQSSCASQSTRRSARRSSCSSRHYWDIGGSLGTGSVIASNGPMGSWGEI